MRPGASAFVILLGFNSGMSFFSLHAYIIKYLFKNQLKPTIPSAHHLHP